MRKRDTSFSLRRCNSYSVLRTRAGKQSIGVSPAADDSSPCRGHRWRIAGGRAKEKNGGLLRRKGHRDGWLACQPAPVTAVTRFGQCTAKSVSERILSKTNFELGA